MEKVEAAIVESVVRTRDGNIIENAEGVLCLLNKDGIKMKNFIPKETLIEVGLLVPKIVQEHEVTPVEATRKKGGKCEWSFETTKYLFGLYDSYLNSVGPLQQFKSKASMWKKIAEEVSALGVPFTAAQCENRYKTIVRRNAKSNESKSREDDASSGEGAPSDDGLLTADKDDHKTKKKKMTLSSVLYKIHKEKEANRERRHKEKMELIMKLLKQGR